MKPYWVLAEMVMGSKVVGDSGIESSYDSSVYSWRSDVSSSIVTVNERVMGWGYERGDMILELAEHHRFPRQEIWEAPETRGN